jgi:hypothetical protein
VPAHTPLSPVHTADDPQPDQSPHVGAGSKHVPSPVKHPADPPQPDHVPHGGGEPVHCPSPMQTALAPQPTQIGSAQSPPQLAWVSPESQVPLPQAGPQSPGQLV